MILYCDKTAWKMTSFIHIAVVQENKEDLFFFCQYYFLLFKNYGEEVWCMKLLSIAIMCCIDTFLLEKFNVIGKSIERDFVQIWKWNVNKIHASRCTAQIPHCDKYLFFEMFLLYVELELHNKEEKSHGRWMFAICNALREVKA